MEYFDYEIECEKETEQYVIPKLIRNRFLRMRLFTEQHQMVVCVLSHSA